MLHFPPDDQSTYENIQRGSEKYCRKGELPLNRDCVHRFDSHSGLS